jgi:hypothetical protein
MILKEEHKINEEEKGKKEEEAEGITRRRWNKR